MLVFLKILFEHQNRADRAAGQVGDPILYRQGLRFDHRDGQHVAYSEKRQDAKLLRLILRDTPGHLWVDQAVAEHAPLDVEPLRQGTDQRRG